MEYPYFNTSFDYQFNTMDSYLSIYPSQIENNIMTELPVDDYYLENSNTPMIADNSILYNHESSSLTSSPSFYTPYSTEMDYFDHLMSPSSFSSSSSSSAASFVTPYQLNDTTMIDYFTINPTSLRNNHILCSYLNNTTSEFQRQILYNQQQQQLSSSSSFLAQTISLPPDEHRLLKYEDINSSPIISTPPSPSSSSFKSCPTNKKKKKNKTTTINKRCYHNRYHHHCLHQEKIFPCNYCQTMFSRKYDAIRHKRIHTGDKPYVCPCCSKQFSRSDARTRHFRTERLCRDGPEELNRNKNKKKSH